MLHVPLIVFLLNDSHLLVRWLEKKHKNITLVMNPMVESVKNHLKKQTQSPRESPDVNLPQMLFYLRNP